jgi:hypothetical protein
VENFRQGPSRHQSKDSDSQHKTETKSWNLKILPNFDSPADCLSEWCKKQKKSAFFEPKLLGLGPHLSQIMTLKSVVNSTAPRNTNTNWTHKMNPALAATAAAAPVASSVKRRRRPTQSV